MLLAVEGGGFFSSSATGYTNGLALLILGRRNEEKPIKVSPWNHYHLVEQESSPHSHAHSRESRTYHGCPSLCFGCPPAGQDGPSSGKVGLVRLSDASSDSLSSSDGANLITTNVTKRSEKKACLKSNLKKPSRDCSVSCESDGAHELLEERTNETSSFTVTRKVQWPDKCGKELVEIREFEVIDEDLADEEYKSGSFRRCECVIQ